MAEHLIVVQDVEGSSPFIHPNTIKPLIMGFFVFCNLSFQFVTQKLLNMLELGFKNYSK
jgi:hypothetical protein